MTTYKPTEYPGIEVAAITLADSLHILRGNALDEARAILTTRNRKLIAGYRARTLRPAKEGRSRCPRCGGGYVPRADGSLRPHGPLIDGERGTCEPTFETKAYIYGRKIHATPAKAIGAMLDQLDGKPERGEYPGDVRFLGDEEQRKRTDDAYRQGALQGGDFRAWREERAKLPG